MHQVRLMGLVISVPTEVVIGGPFMAGVIVELIAEIEAVAPVEGAAIGAMCAAGVLT